MPRKSSSGGVARPRKQTGLANRNRTGTGTYSSENKGNRRHKYPKYETPATQRDIPKTKEGKLLCRVGQGRRVLIRRLFRRNLSSSRLRVREFSDMSPQPMYVTIALPDRSGIGPGEATEIVRKALENELPPYSVSASGEQPARHARVIRELASNYHNNLLSAESAMDAIAAMVL